MNPTKVLVDHLLQALDKCIVDHPDIPLYIDRHKGRVLVEDFLASYNMGKMEVT